MIKTNSPWVCALMQFIQKSQDKHDFHPSRGNPQNIEKFKVQHIFNIFNQDFLQL